MRQGPASGLVSRGQVFQGTGIVAPACIHLGECEGQIDGHPAPVVPAPFRDSQSLGQLCHAYGRMVPRRARCRSRARKRCELFARSLCNRRSSVWVMDVEKAIRGRRTHKVYAPEPVERELLDELLELAAWAPNHNLTN